MPIDYDKCGNGIFIDDNGNAQSDGSAIIHCQYPPCLVPVILQTKEMQAEEISPFHYEADVWDVSGFKNAGIGFEGMAWRIVYFTEYMFPYLDGLANCTYAQEPTVERDDESITPTYGRISLSGELLCFPDRVIYDIHAYKGIHSVQIIVPKTFSGNVVSSYAIPTYIGGSPSGQFICDYSLPSLEQAVSDCQTTP